MTAKVQIRNGGVVEDTTNDVNQPNALAEVYTVGRVLKNAQGQLRYGIRDYRRNQDEYADDYELPEDSDIVRWHEALKNLTINGIDLGAIQRDANSFSGNDYFNQHVLGEAIQMVEANDSEKTIAEKIGLEHKDRDKRVLKTFDTQMVPTTPDGTAMPLFVTSNDRNEGTMTFEEAEEVLESFLTHVEVDTDNSEPDTTDEEASDNQTDESDDSDHQSVNDPTRIDGIGEATIEKLENGGFEAVPKADIADHIEVEPFEFESDESAESGMPSPQEVIELQENGWSKEEIKEMYC